MYKDRVGVQVVASRPDYLAVLLTSLKTQTYNKWDLVLVVQDEEIIRNPLVSSILERLQLEGHRVSLMLANRSLGLCEMRNMALENDKCEYGLRIDDDSLCEPDFIQLLVSKMPAVCGGVVPPIRTYTLAPIRNDLNEVDKDGNIKDDFLPIYNTSESFEVDHIRSSMMYVNEEARKIKFPTYNDSLASFREETDFCIRMKLAGTKIIFYPKAICWHFLAGYGGCRDFKFKDPPTAIKEADMRFRRKLKEYGWDKYKAERSKDAEKIKKVAGR